MFNFVKPITVPVLLVIMFFLSIGVQATSISTTKNSLKTHVGMTQLLRLNKPAHTIFIADPSVASFQATTNSTLLVFGRKPGLTSLYALDELGNSVYSTNIKVGFDLSKIAPTLKREFPGSNVQIRPYGSSIVLSGQVPDAATATQMIALSNQYLSQIASSSTTGEQGNTSSQQGEDESRGGTGIGGYQFGTVINRLVINSPTQVNIRVRIAEVSKTVQEKFGFQWNSLYSNSSTINNITEDILFAKNPIIKAFTNTPDVIGMVDILAEENLVTVLAEPNLTASSGETASFLAGGEVPQIINGGDSGSVIEYRQFGVLLAVTPTILSGNRIALKVRTEISDISSANSVSLDGDIQRGFDIRRAETSVELASGQSFALAGLMKRGVSDEMQNIPWINEIPVLGRLFESSQFKNKETELVIIASAYLVEPVRVPLSLPTDGVHPSSPFERLLFGRSLQPIQDYQAPPVAIAKEVFEGFEF